MQLGCFDTQPIYVKMQFRLSDELMMQMSMHVSMHVKVQKVCSVLFNALSTSGVSNKSHGEPEWVQVFGITS